jgi:cytoskeletal protein CcmA (bactofilin family)
MKSNKNTFEVTLLAKGMKLKGDLQSLSDVRIEGEIDGSVVTLGKIIISEEASVIGDVSASSFELHGKFKGNISIDDHVILAGTSDFEGIVLCKSIEIMKGSKFLGKINSHDGHSNLEDKDFDDKVVNLKPINFKMHEANKQAEHSDRVSGETTHKKTANGFENEIYSGGKSAMEGYF